MQSGGQSDTSGMFSPDKPSNKRVSSPLTTSNVLPSSNTSTPLAQGSKKLLSNLLRNTTPQQKQSSNINNGSKSDNDIMITSVIPAKHSPVKSNATPTSSMMKKSTKPVSTSETFPPAHIRKQAKPKQSPTKSPEFLTFPESSADESSPTKITSPSAMTSAMKRVLQKSGKLVKELSPTGVKSTSIPSQVKVSGKGNAASTSHVKITTDKEKKTTTESPTTVTMKVYNMPMTLSDKKMTLHQIIKSKVSSSAATPTTLASTSAVASTSSHNKQGPTSEHPRPKVVSDVIEILSSSDDESPAPVPKTVSTSNTQNQETSYLKISSSTGQMSLVSETPNINTTQGKDAPKISQVAQRSMSPSVKIIQDKMPQLKAVMQMDQMSHPFKKSGDSDKDKSYEPTSEEISSDDDEKDEYLPPKKRKRRLSANRSVPVHAQPPTSQLVGSKSQQPLSESQRMAMVQKQTHMQYLAQQQSALNRQKALLSTQNKQQTVPSSVQRQQIVPTSVQQQTATQSVQRQTSTQSVQRQTTTQSVLQRQLAAPTNIQRQTSVPSSVQRQQVIPTSTVQRQTVVPKQIQQVQKQPVVSQQTNPTTIAASSTASDSDLDNEQLFLDFDMTDLLSNI